EDRVIFAPPAQDLHRALQLVGAADQWIQLTGTRAVGQVQGVRREWIARRGTATLALSRFGFIAAMIGPRAAAARWHLADAMRDVLEHVEPRDALPREQLCRIGFVLLQRRRENIAGLDFL